MGLTKDQKRQKKKREQTKARATAQQESTRFAKALRAVGDSLYEWDRETTAVGGAGRLSAKMNALFADGDALESPAIAQIRTTPLFRTLENITLELTAAHEAAHLDGQLCAPLSGRLYCLLPSSDIPPAHAVEWQMFLSDHEDSEVFSYVTGELADLLFAGHGKDSARVYVTGLRLGATIAVLGIIRSSDGDLSYYLIGNGKWHPVHREGVRVVIHPLSILAFVAKPDDVGAMVPIEALSAKLRSGSIVFTETRPRAVKEIMITLLPAQRHLMREIDCLADHAYQQRAWLWQELKEAGTDASREFNATIEDLENQVADLKQRLRDAKQRPPAGQTPVAPQSGRSVKLTLTQRLGAVLGY